MPLPVKCCFPRGVTLTQVNNHNHRLLSSRNRRPLKCLRSRFLSSRSKLLTDALHRVRLSIIHKVFLREWLMVLSRVHSLSTNPSRPRRSTNSRNTSSPLSRNTSNLGISRQGISNPSNSPNPNLKRRRAA